MSLQLTTDNKKIFDIMRMETIIEMGNEILEIYKD